MPFCLECHFSELDVSESLFLNGLSKCLSLVTIFLIFLPFSPKEDNIPPLKAYQSSYGFHTELITFKSCINNYLCASLNSHGSSWFGFILDHSCIQQVVGKHLWAKWIYMTSAILKQTYMPDLWISLVLSLEILGFTGMKSFSALVSSFLKSIFIY